MIAALALLAAAAADPELRRELLAMEREEQAPFHEKALVDLGPADWERIGEIRKRNSARLAEIVAKRGWPGIGLVGRDGSNAAHIVAQPPTDLAYLTDRVLVNEGRKQVYGTQTEEGPDGKLRPMPVEDPKGLDRRRKSVGLGSERSYLRPVERIRRRPLP